MKDNLKRSLTYLVKTQGKAIAVQFLVSLIYGFVMGFVFESGPAGDRLTAAYIFSCLMTAIFVLVSHVGYYNTNLQLMLGMGCTRKAIDIGQHVITLMLLVIDSLGLVVVGLICQMKAYMTPGNISLVIMLLCLIVSLGLLTGFITARFEKMGAWLMVIIIVAVSITGAIIGITQSEQGTTFLAFVQSPTTKRVGWTIAAVLYLTASVLSSRFIKKVEHN